MMLYGELHQRLELQSRNAGIRMSERNRQTLEKGINKDPIAGARAFFDGFEPLESLNTGMPTRVSARSVPEA
jgi:hypothetical protein